MRKLFSLLMVALFSASMWAADPVPAGTTLFSEDFSSYKKDSVPAGEVKTSTGRVVYGGATAIYTCVNGGSNTKVYEENTGGGTSPEILVGKTSSSATGSFKIEGIPSGSAKEITVSWTQNKQKLKVEASGKGYSGSSEAKPSAVGTVTLDVKVADDADATFTLTISATGSSNVRVDDILVTVKTAGESSTPITPDPESTIKTVYCKCEQGWWTADGAAVGIYAFTGETVKNADYPGVRMEAVAGETGLWKADLDTAKYANVIFTRVNGSGDIENWGAKTTDLTVPVDKNLYTITSSTAVWGDPGVDGSWSVYVPAKPAEDITFYLINNQEWAAPTAHVFVGETAEAAWPGKAMTKTEDKVNGFDVYSYTFKDNYTKIIFNDGKAENTIQTVDLEWAKEKPYFVPGAKNGEGKLEGTWYATKEEIPAPAVPQDITFYLINNQEWAAPTAHVFVGETAEAAWPGKAMTKTEDKVNGFDVYSYTFLDSYTKIIFNNGNNEAMVQTVDLEWAKEKPYFVPGAKNGEGKLEGTWYATKEEIPAPPVELQAVSAETTWDFSKITANTASELYNNNGIQLTASSTPSINDEIVYVNYADGKLWTLAEGFDGTTMAFKGEYPIRKNKNSQNGELHFKTTVPGTITVKFSDTGTTASTTAVKRYLVVNDEQTKYWTSRENNGSEPYAAQLDVTTDAIKVPAGDVTIKGSSAIVVYYVTFAPADPEMQIAGAWNVKDEAWVVNDMRLAEDKLTATYEVELAKGDYEFKVIKDGAWLTKNNGDAGAFGLHREYPGVAGVKDDAANNLKVTADAAGKYIFTWTFANDSIGIDFPAPEPAAKYYIVGNAEAFGEWSKFVPVYEDTYEIKDMPAGDYMFRLCMEDGVWTTDYGYAQLTVKPDGVSTNDDNNICFKFKEASDLKITYKPADGENPAVFTVAGNFYYKPVVTKEIKLVPNQWAEANAKIAAWVWDKEGEMTNYFTDFFAPIAEENDTLVAKINVEADSIIFVRFNASAAEPKWEGGEGYQWNQTPNDSIQWEKGIFTILPSEGYESKGTWDVYVPETPAKFYITGDSALVVDAGLTVDKKWEPNAIKSEAVSYKLNLKAGVDYMLKITLNGTWEGENNVKGYDEMTTPKNGLYRGEGENANNICFKLNADGEVSVHYDGEFFFLNGDFYVVPEPEKKYYLKNNWNGAEEWTWKEMTKKDAYYQLENVVFGGKGVNINTAESEEGQTWIAATDIAAMDMSTYEMTTLGALDTVVFVFDPEAVDSYTGENGLSAYIIGKYVEPAVPENVTIYFVNDENWEQVYTYVWYGASSSKAEWPGEPATKTELKARGYDVYSYTFPETYTKIIFNNNGSKQSTDLVWDIAKPYIYKNNCYASIDDIPEVIVEPKFRIAGNEALVIAAGLTADYAWNPGAIKAYEDTYTFENLPVGDYKLKLSVDGTWSTAMGYSDLSEKVDGLDADAAEYICFTLAEAGNVKVTYKAAEGENPAVFKVEGKFLVKVHTYTVVGNSTVIAAGWDETSTATEMILKDGVYTLIVEGVELLPATNYDYKIVYDHAWDVAYPQSGNASFSVEKSGIYDVLFTFDPETKAYAAIPELKKEIIVVPTVEIAGTFNEWQGAKLNVSEDKSTASIKLNLAKANYLFKIIIAGNWYGTGQSVTRTNTKLVVPETVEVEMSLIADATGEYTFTWTYATNEIAVTYPANADPDRLSEGFYLIGLNGWDVENIQPADKFIVNPNETSEYQLANVKLKAGDEFKAVYVFNDEIVGWYPNEDIKYVVTAEQAGTATIYFRSEYYTPWNGHFYVKVDESGTGMDNTAVDGKAVKMIKNGMFVIEKDGKTYNVMGVTIR